MASRKYLASCSVHGCPTLTRESRCDKHKREADRKRGSASERGYDATWQATRKAYLQLHPFCQDEAGCIEIATDVDHIDGLGPKGPRGHDHENLRAYCHSHHSQRTARDQSGGWNKPHG